MKKGKRYTHLQKRHGQPHYNPLRSHGLRPLGAHFWAHEGEDHDWEQSAWFSKVFDMPSHNNLVSKLGCYNLDSWTTRWKKLVGWSVLMVNG